MAIIELSKENNKFAGHAIVCETFKVVVHPTISRQTEVLKAVLGTVEIFGTLHTPDDLENIFPYLLVINLFNFLAYLLVHNLTILLLSGPSQEKKKAIADHYFAGKTHAQILGLLIP